MSFAASRLAGSMVRINDRFDQDTPMDEPSRTVESCSTLVCPECGHKAREKMPENACIRRFECAGCGTLLAPMEGDCCVFCSYGDVRCPPVQRGNCC